MSNELVGLNLNLPATVTDEDFSELAKAGDWLPRLQLCGASCNLCKEGLIPVGRFAIVNRKDSFQEIGPSVNVLVLSLRLKAMRIGEQVISFFNPKNPEFNKIRSLSEIKDSGCMCGPEFLVYIPVAKVYAGFYCANKTMRGEAPKLKALLGRSATIDIALISNPKHKWHGPKISPCSIPLEIPPVAQLNAQIEKFNNAPESMVEVVDTPTERVR